MEAGYLCDDLGMTLGLEVKGAFSSQVVAQLINKFIRVIEGIFELFEFSKSL